MAPWPASRPLCQPKLLLTDKHRSPPLPAPAAAEAALPRQEAPSLVSYKCLSEGGGLSECGVRVSRRSLTPCRPSAVCSAQERTHGNSPCQGLGPSQPKYRLRRLKPREGQSLGQGHSACRAWKEASSSFNTLGAFSIAPRFPLSLGLSAHLYNGSSDWMLARNPSSSDSPSYLLICSTTSQRGCNDSCHPTHCPYPEQGL